MYCDSLTQRPGCKVWLSQDSVARSARGGMQLVCLYICDTERSYCTCYFAPWIVKAEMHEAGMSEVPGVASQAAMLGRDNEAWRQEQTVYKENAALSEDEAIQTSALREIIPTP